MKKTIACTVFLSISLFLFCGCPTPKDKYSTSPSVSPANAGHNHDFGPDGGTLAVLGAHQYHAEAVANETSGDVEIRVYTPSNAPTTVDANEMTLNRIVDGKPKPYSIPFVEGGKTATFKINDLELAEAISDRSWDDNLQVSLVVADIPYSGTFSKAKPGADHDHDHHHH